MVDIFNKIKRLLLPKNKDEINDIIDLSNMSSVKMICIITAIAGVLSMLRYFILYYNNLYVNITTIATIAVILLSLIIAGLSELFLKGKIHGHNVSVCIVYLCIIVISAFCLYTSYTNYKLDRQILVLFIANISIISFILITPLYHVLLLIVENLFFYALLYCYDGAKDIVFINALLYLVVIVIVCIISYHRMINSIIATYEARQLAEDFYIKSSIDQLTGLMNRYALESIKIKKGVTTHVAMTDIDLFKTFNDTFGHLKGDEVIKMAASNLFIVFRRKDCFRYGGDEFLIMTTKLSEDTFKSRLSTWAKIVYGTKVEGIDTPINVSYGVASGVINTKEDLMELIEKADNELYKIKSIKHNNT
ncbi:GGDEF domain-containing protein [Butyrivibrio fibrisolvens]|uniref:GGDEF domain-containing protein n=1 Tax=Butyrivibrio fibrisolvens TaxID=831 RepID=UPI0003B4E86C|nr:GGDEF domain-containing protein [Butyrivibrio fibrisolvens]